MTAGPRISLELRHAVEADQLPLAVAEIDLCEVGLLQELAVLGLDPDVVALTVAGLVVVLGDVDAAGQHVERGCHVVGAQAERLRRGPVGLEHELRQVELQVGVHAPDRRVVLQRALASRRRFRPISCRFGPLTTNCSGSVRWPGNTPKPRANTRAPGDLRELAADRRREPAAASACPSRDVRSSAASGRQASPGSLAARCPAR